MGLNADVIVTSEYIQTCICLHKCWRPLHQFVIDDRGLITVCWALFHQDDSRPPLYEETTGRQMDQEGDSSEDDEEELKGPPPEPTRFGWVQGVMVGLIVI